MFWKSSCLLADHIQGTGNIPESNGCVEWERRQQQQQEQGQQQDLVAPSPHTHTHVHTEHWQVCSSILSFHGVTHPGFFVLEYVQMPRWKIDYNSVFCGDE